MITCPLEGSILQWFGLHDHGARFAPWSCHQNDCATGIIFEVWVTLRLFKDTLLRKKIINVNTDYQQKEKRLLFRWNLTFSARACVSILCTCICKHKLWKDKRKIPLRALSDLYWENKTCKLNRSLSESVNPLVCGLRFRASKATRYEPRDIPLLIKFHLHGYLPFSISAVSFSSSSCLAWHKKSKTNR